jgi:peptidoglycan/LPS O-acetylase OafA/YrhL
MSATEDPKTEDLKAVEYYAATVNAWYATRLERDKSLLTLAAAGVGVLVVLMSGIHSVEGLVVFILALAAFAVSLGAVLWIFHRNSSHLQSILSSPTTGA